MGVCIQDRAFAMLEAIGGKQNMYAKPFFESQPSLLGSLRDGYGAHLPVVRRL